MNPFVKVFAHNNSPYKNKPLRKVAYVARVAGTDPSTVLRREFGRVPLVVRAEDCPVLVAQRNVNDKNRADDHYFLFLVGADGGVVASVRDAEVTADDALWLAEQMDLGYTLDSSWDRDGWRRSTADQKTSAPAVRVEEALQACYEKVAALTDGEFKLFVRSLRALRKPEPEPAEAPA